MYGILIYPQQNFRSRKKRVFGVNRPLEPTECACIYYPYWCPDTTMWTWGGTMPLFMSIAPWDVVTGDVTTKQLAVHKSQIAPDTSSKSRAAGLAFKLTSAFLTPDRGGKKRETVCLHMSGFCQEPYVCPQGLVEIQEKVLPGVQRLPREATLEHRTWPVGHSMHRHIQRITSMNNGHTLFH